MIQKNWIFMVNLSGALIGSMSAIIAISAFSHQPTEFSEKCSAVGVSIAACAQMFQLAGLCWMTGQFKILPLFGFGH